MVRSGINHFKARRYTYSVYIIVKRSLLLNKGFQEKGAKKPLKGWKGDNGGIVQRHESGRISMKGDEGFLVGMG
jgi:hypothetical protein